VIKRNVFSRFSAHQRCKTLSPYPFINLDIPLSLSNSASRLASVLVLEWYGPRVLAQHIDDGEYIRVVVASVETQVRAHLNDISLLQIVVSPDYDAPLRKISSRRSVQFLDESTSLGVNFSFFVRSLFRDSTRNTQDTRKKNFFLVDATRLTHFDMRFNL